MTSKGLAISLFWADVVRALNVEEFLIGKAYQSNSSEDASIGDKLANLITCEVHHAALPFFKYKPKKRVNEAVVIFSKATQSGAIKFSCVECTQI